MTRPLAVLDTEVFPNYFLLGLRAIDGHDAPQFFELDGERPFPVAEVRAALKRYTLVSFNGKNFDELMITLALAGRDCAAIKKAAGMIINTNLKPWTAAAQLGVKIPQWDHIDLIEVAPGQASLKVYAGRLHAREIRDLPFDPERRLEPGDFAIVRDYCAVDLENTVELYRALEPQVHLREQMSEQYGQDLRSRGDAQIAEHVIKAEVEAITGHPAPRPEVPDSQVIRYVPPRYVGFDMPVLRDLLKRIRETRFQVTGTGKITLPEFLEEPVTIGGGEYRMGIGGLHSSESSRALVADGYELIDHDVASYYPQIILNDGLCPPALGPTFTKVYRAIVDRRLAAKRAGDKVTAETLKIVVNGSFGKTSNKYSTLYSPTMFLHVVLTGQLSLLMLIEYLEQNGYPVVSANTDGIVVRTAPAGRERLKNLVGGWELTTGFVTEEAHYTALYSRDVNNYVALKADGVKLKGVYARASLAKNPAGEVCVDAVLAYLRDGMAITKTIYDCKDIRRFLFLRKVQGGAVDQAGFDLGRTVRWYYSTEETQPLRYKVNGYKVPETDGARACLVLPDHCPSDLHRAWYVQRAQAMLDDLGATRRQGDLLDAA